MSFGFSDGYNKGVGRIAISWPGMSGLSGDGSLYQALGFHTNHEYCVNNIHVTGFFIRQKGLVQLRELLAGKTRFCSTQDLEYKHNTMEKKPISSSKQLSR